MTIRTCTLLLSILLLAACDGGTKERKAARGENFVPAPNALFFKNTRQRDYRLTDRGEAGNFFTHEDLQASPATVLPVIHHDWINDRAYLQLHTRSAAGPASPSGPVKLFITSATGTNAVSLAPKLDVAATKRFAHHLSTNRPIRQLVGKDTVDVFPGEARRHARESLADFLRLVDAD